MARIGPQDNKAELLLDMMEAYLAGNESTPRGASAPHFQIHVHECPACEKTTVQTVHGEKELTKTEVEVVQCDANIRHPGRRSQSIIPPRIRREVLARDRHRCRRKGCSHSRFLEIHHLIPRAQGGSHDPTNLVTLCSSCHQFWHQKGGDLGSLLGPSCDRLTANANPIPQPVRAVTCSKPPVNF